MSRMSRDFSMLKVRPCERRKFLNFSFSRVSELFGYRSWEFFWKNPFFSEFAKILWKKFGNKFGSKTLDLEAKTGVLCQKQGFLKIPNLQNIQNLFYSEFSKNYEKMMLKLNFYFHEKLVPTQIPTWIFEFKFGMQGLS